jgi:primary-amine oxidase
VLGFHTGDTVPRRATVFFRQNKKSFKSTVNLTSGTFTAPVEIPPSDGQLGLTFQEIIDFAFVFQDAGFLKAMARRGIDTPEELAKVLVTPLTPGSFGLPEEKRRIVKAQMYNTAGAGINLFARPIEGVQAIVDLDDRKVLAVLDTGVVPVSPADGGLRRGHGGRALTGCGRRSSRSASPSRRGRTSRSNGGFVSWQKWKFHVRFERRAGAVISLVTYDGRSCSTRARWPRSSCRTRIPAPTGTTARSWTPASSASGALSSPLKLGLDVPENAVLLDGLISAALPDPTVPVVPLPAAAVVGVFERVTGNPIWRHYEFLANGAYEGRAEVELVVRMISQVGNYDYLIDWVFTQHGTIRVDVGAHRHRHPQGRAQHHGERSHRVGGHRLRHARGAADRRALPQPSLQFPARRGRGRAQQQLRARQAEDRVNVQGSPRKSVWVLDEETLAREKDARLDEPDVWKVVSTARKNALGYPTARRWSRTGTPTRYSRRRLPPGGIHRARVVGHRVRCRRALRRRRHAQPESRRARPAALRGRQREHRQPRHRALAHGDLPPRHCRRGLPGAPARARVLRAQAAQLLRPQTRA